MSHNVTMDVTESRSATSLAPREAAVAARTGSPSLTGAGTADLRTLVNHRFWLAADASLESAHKFFSSHELEFIAVLEGDRVLGLCARRQVGIVLGSRYGFSLFSRNPVREYLLPQALVVRVADPIPPNAPTSVHATGRVFLR